ncbi:CPBP family intramembrane glutamic endopeptidase [Salibacterium halotolerans]|uniref:CAAX protease self-immunity n=1 Tax=Salibacterium halotolerans TaxID=1884432 RepID=A0A1I5SWJ9_9BACI|nr:CPBP family intramembrane glutamic endopeptidase [Salibacterium halotolerans]SFP75152.1 CAAX protease self-immunity [Salibacterium halotolerans]
MNQPTEIPDDLPLGTVWKSFAFLAAAAALLMLLFQGPEYMRNLWSLDHVLQEAAAGAGAGIVFAAVVLGLYAVSAIKLPDNVYIRLIERLAAKKYGLFTIAVGAGVSEEFLFRGALLGMTAGFTGETPALLLISLLFMALHIPQYKGSILIHVIVFMMGVVLGLLFLRTEALWAPVAAHAVYNAVLTWFMKKRKPLEES